MHRWNIFLIEVLSTPSSPQIKIVKPPDKRPGISDRSSFLLRRSVKFLVRLAETVLQNSPGRAASKATWLHYSSSEYTKNCSCVCARCAYGSIIWKRTSYRNDDLSVSAAYTKPVVSANWHILSNDQSNACVANTTSSVNASCSDVITVPLFFSPLPPTAIIHVARPSGTFETQDGRH